MNAKRFASLISTGINIAIGYVWAKHGIVTALELWGATLVVLLALYGTLTILEARYAK